MVSEARHFLGNDGIFKNLVGMDYNGGTGQRGQDRGRTWHPVQLLGVCVGCMVWNLGGMGMFLV